MKLTNEQKNEMWPYMYENGGIMPRINDGAYAAHFGELPSKERMGVLQWLFLNIREAKPKEASAFITSSEIAGLLWYYKAALLTAVQVQEALLLLGIDPWDIKSSEWVYRVSRECPCSGLYYDGISGLQTKNRCCHVAGSRVDIV